MDSNLKHVLDLVPLPFGTKVSDDGEAFADHIRQVQEVMAALKASNEDYANEANLHHRIKEFKRETYCQLICSTAQFLMFDLYSFKGFDGNAAEISDQVQQLPTTRLEVIEDVLDVKKVRSRRGNKYRRFLVKWLGNPASKITWIAEEKLQRVNPEIYAEVVKVFSPELSFPSQGE
ncbi:hypothetical protein V6Z11_D06G139500 [Gossypium hirsutum]